MLLRRGFLAAVAGVPFSQRKDHAPKAPLLVSLRILVATCAGKAVQPDAWVADHVAAAAAIFGEQGIALTFTLEPFEPTRCALLTRVHRDEMAAFAPSVSQVHVLVMERVRDLDVPSYDLMGVHWRAQARRWVFLTTRAKPPVLAHELCHFFGIPHDPQGGNLMTPGPSAPHWRGPHPPKPFAPCLTHVQAQQLRKGVGLWINGQRRQD